jgi:hypothetical protein
MSKKKVGVLVDTVNNTIEDQYESHEMFLTRRSKQMAGMIGLLSSRLEIVNMNLKFDMEYDTMTADQWRREAKQNRVEILECLIRYQHEWANMQEYTETDYGMEMYKNKIEEYTTELEALKTLAL